MHESINPSYKATETFWKTMLMLLLISFYAFLLYLMYSENTLDFLSFYTSRLQLTNGVNPYQIFAISIPPKLVAANLNPPIMLWLISPLSHLNYYFALSIWLSISFILGLLGARIAFYYAFPSVFLRRNGFYLYLIYLVSFPVLMDFGLAQFGAVLLFFTMLGYDFYMKQHDYAAGILWGIIIAIKFFPGLLIAFVIVQRRFKTFVAMIGTILLLTLIPLLFYSMTIYSQYFAMMTEVNWYGKNWNGSILGMLYRLFITNSSWQFIRLTYFLLFCTLFIIYLRQLIKFEKLQIPHYSFCITIVMMLLLSPLGWLYYFPLLLFPLALSWRYIILKKQCSKLTKFNWYLCLFFICMPINNIPIREMKSFLAKLSFCSFNFYGLVLLLYLIYNLPLYLQNLNCQIKQND